MSFRTTIILAVIVAALAAFAYYDSKQSEKKKEQEEKEKTLLELKKEDVTEIQVQRARDTVRIVSSGKDRWELKEPIQTRADDASVGRITSAFEKLKYKDIVEEQPKNLKEYELDQPAATFTITTKQGKKHTILVGAQNPVMRVNYLRINNDPRVYTVEGDLANVGSLSLLELRDKKLTDFNSEKVESVRLKTKDLDVVFQKSAGTWKMIQPVESPASDSEVSSLLSSLEFLRAAQFIDQPDIQPQTQTSSISTDAQKDSLESIGLAKPTATVEITLEKGLKQKIDFGNKLGEQIYVRVEGNPSLAQVSDSFSNFFSKKLDEWREKKLIVFNRFDVEDIRIKHQSVEYNLRKGKEDTWLMGSPQKGEVDTEKVQAVLEKLELAEIEKYEDKASLDTAPTLEIFLGSKDWQNVQSKRHLAFGTVSGDSQPVKNDAYNNVVFVKATTSKQLIDELSALKVKPPQTKPADAKKK